MQQAVFTPAGTAINAQNGLLVTPLRIFPTTLLNPQKSRVVFVDPADIDHNVKRANKNAMEFYVETKVHDCKKGLLKKLLQQYHKRDYVFDWELDKIPIEVAEKYSANIIRYKNAALLNYAEETFLRYICKIEHEHRYLVLHHHELNQSRLMLLLTRYHKSYCKKIKKRMAWLSHEYGNRSAVLLTLTLDPKKFNNDKFLMWDTFTKELNRFMEAVRIRFKREGRAFPKYLWAPEGQKNGNPHIHIVFFNARRLLDWRELLQYWGKGAIYINRTKDNQKVRYPINYVTGYITKTFGNINFDNIRTQSLIWLFNHHSFNRSHGLVVPLNPKGCGDWVLGYLAVVDNHNNPVCEMDLIWSRLDMMFDPSLWVKPPPIEASVDQFQRWRAKQMELLEYEKKENGIEKTSINS